MQAIVIFGPAAVGKMTVGYELQKICDYKLFHNHMVSELIYNFWGYNDPRFGVLNNQIRKIIFSELGKSKFPGIIFTYVWALDCPDDEKEILSYLQCLNINIKDVLFVELEADQDTRIERNKTEFRLKEKKSKNNIKESENFIRISEQTYSLNTDNNFMYPDQHIKINNNDKSPELVAKLIYEEMVKRKFQLSVTPT